MTLSKKSYQTFRLIVTSLENWCINRNKISQLALSSRGVCEGEKIFDLNFMTSFLLRGISNLSSITHFRLEKVLKSKMHSARLLLRTSLHVSISKLCEKFYFHSYLSGHKNRDSLKENKLKNRSRKENEFLWVARARHEEHYMQVM